VDQVNEDELYGAGFPLVDKLKLLAEWAPLLARLQAVAGAETPHERAVALVKTLQWAAGKSMTEIDDEVLSHIEAILKTPEGKSFFDWVVAQVSE
jgi:hypothetical protein